MCEATCTVKMWLKRLRLCCIREVLVMFTILGKRGKKCDYGRCETAENSSKGRVCFSKSFFFFVAVSSSQLSQLWLSCSCCYCCCMDALRFVASFLLFHLRLEGLEVVTTVSIWPPRQFRRVERSSKGPAYIMQSQVFILLPFTLVIPISHHYFCRSESITFPVCNLLSWQLKKWSYLITS